MQFHLMALLKEAAYENSKKELLASIIFLFGASYVIKINF